MCFVTERSESPASEDPFDIEDTPTKSGHPVNEYFECVSLFKQQFKCKLCGWTTIRASVRRKMEHILQTGTGSAKPCKPTQALEMEAQEVLLSALKELDDSVEKKRKFKQQKKAAASGLRCPKRQRKISFVSKEDKDMLDMKFARMCIMNAVKTGFLESDITREFFEVSVHSITSSLPDHNLLYEQSEFNYTPPSRQQVMGPLLDQLYEDCKKQVLAYCNFKDPDSMITMSMDGWESPTREHIRNYVWVSDGYTFFFDATNNGAERPTAANIAAEAISMITKTGEENVAGLTNDNASAETTSWDAIRDRFLHVLCTGCSCHAVNLLFKDVCDHAWAAKIIKKAVFVAKFFKNHQYTNHEIRTRTEAAHGKSYVIILHGATRFAGVYYVLKRLCFLRTILREIKASAGFEEINFPDAEEVTDILDDSVFWKQCEQLRLFLKPLKCLIKLLDHDCNVTHHVYPGMYLVNQTWQANEADVPSAFKKHALKELKYRWEWLTFPIHYITYGLSPNYHDDNIFANAKVMAGIKEVVKFFAPDEAYHQAMREFTMFKQHQDDDMFTRDADDNILMGIAPKTWWQLHGANWPVLQPIAIRIFSVGTSSSASERNFSVWSHIWSNRANKLSFDRAVKMVYVYTNLRTLLNIKSGNARKAHVESNWLATEIEE